MELERTAFVLETLSETALTPGTLTMAGTLIGCESLDISNEDAALEGIADAVKEKISSAMESIGAVFSNAIGGIKKLIGEGPSASDIAKLPGAVKSSEAESPHVVRNILLFVTASLVALGATFALIRTGKIPGTTGLNKWMDDAFINSFKKAFGGAKDATSWESYRKFWRSVYVGGKAAPGAPVNPQIAAKPAQKLLTGPTWSKGDAAKALAVVNKVPESMGQLSKMPSTLSILVNPLKTAGTAAIDGVRSSVIILNNLRRQTSFVIGSVVRSGCAKVIGILKSLFHSANNVGRAA